MFTASIGIFIFGLLAALAGGYFGAAIGANYAFVLTGFSILMSWSIYLATESTVGFDWIAFGPFMGPHVGFAGGVAAAAFAASKGYLETGRDVNTPLASLGRQDVLFVGSIFGAGAYLVNIAYGLILVAPKGDTMMGMTDTVAMTVVTSAIVARLVFGNLPGMTTGRSLLNPEKYNKSGGFMGKIAPNDVDCWLPWQEKWGYLVGLSLMFGMAASSVALAMGVFIPGAAGLAHTFPFAISAIIIFFLIEGHNMPVQHHITIIGGLGAITFMPAFAGAGFEWGATKWGDTAALASSPYLMPAIGAVIVGAIFAIISGLLGEFWSRMFHQRGTTHIDPPAFAIFTTTTLMMLVKLIAL